MKTLSKLEIEGNFLKLIENVYKKPTAYNIFNAERLDALLLRLEIIQGNLLHHSYSTMY